MSRADRLISPHVARVLRTAGLVHNLGFNAARLGVRFVVLKGAALHLLRLVRIDERPMCDLDVLLTSEDAACLNAELVSQGWKAYGTARGEDHLPALRHPEWPVLELHDQLSGVSRDGASWVTFADLEAAGALSPLPEAGPSGYVPTPDFLAAHAIAHGFFHHGMVPTDYPLQRVFDDLRALHVLELSNEEFFSGPGRWMKRGLPRRDVQTILDLGRRLARGEDVATDVPSTSASRLLAHVRRSASDPAYRSALRLRSFRALAGNGAHPFRTLLKASWRVLFLSRDQVDTIYGRPAHPWGYAVRRVLRPFDLVLRVGRSLVNWLGLRARGEGLPAAGFPFR